MVVHVVKHVFYIMFCEELLFLFLTFGWIVRKHVVAIQGEVDPYIVECIKHHLVKQNMTNRTFI